jgi:hypothetical protein
MSWDRSIDNGLVDKLLDEIVFPHVREIVYSIKVDDVVEFNFVHSEIDCEVCYKLIIRVTFHEYVVPFNYVELIDSINTVIKLMGQCSAYYGIRYKRFCG